eukprot:319460_1
MGALKSKTSAKLSPNILDKYLISGYTRKYVTNTAFDNEINNIILMFVGKYKHLIQLLLKSSSILETEEQTRQLIELLCTKLDIINIEKLFLSQNNDLKSNIDISPQQFYSACDNKGPTIILLNHAHSHVNVKKYGLFGGYTSVPWTSPKDSVFKTDKNAFLFSLHYEYVVNKQSYWNTKIVDIKPHKINQAVQHCAGYGPCFGNKDLCIKYNTFNPMRAGGFGGMGKGFVRTEWTVWCEWNQNRFDLNNVTTVYNFTENDMSTQDVFYWDIRDTQVVMPHKFYECFKVTLRN